MTKTPYYVIDKDYLESNLIKLENAIEENWDNYVIGYSYKTNALPWIIEFFRDHGCYAEVVSDDEYLLAGSVKAPHVIYNGIAKSKDTFIEAILNDQIVNIDANYEIDWLDDLPKGSYGIGIRVNVDLESKCPGQTQCGEEGERFGFCYENGEFERVIKRIEQKGIAIKGIHLHKSSKTRMPDIYRAIAEAAVEIAQTYDLKLTYIDIGGGFFGGLENKPQFDEYFSMISKILQKGFDPKETTLIVEPGMALIGAAVDYITTVKDVKKTTRNIFVVTDGSRIHIDPLMTKSGYFHEIERSDENRMIVTRQVISGFTCMEHDRIFELRESKELKPGDRIIYHKVGAYTMCLSPLFIKWFPEVYVKQSDRIMKVRANWTDRDYMSGSINE